MVLVESNIPPLAQTYNKILTNWSTKIVTIDETKELKSENEHEHGALLENLPVIDLVGLTSEDEGERAECAAEIARASSEWGFFQVVNHGINHKLLRDMRREQIELFNAPFSKKSSCGLLNNSYRWGSPTAVSPDHFSWEVLVEYAGEMQKLAKLLAGVLIENLGQKKEEFEEMISCDESTCFLRLNHYPRCRVSTAAELMHGLVPHTDSDFLTILHQDQVGGLQLLKQSQWISVHPRKDALIVNIGDLFQAWSNDVYKSVEHKVIANPNMERFSVAYFLCPSYDSMIGACKEPSIYRNFTFGEYRSQVQQDSKLIGHKIGLPRFLR
ncbi:PREDICTED: gibberellin 2-beta-dioxygenase 8-like [Erythranthe guttata]|uniref:gibberellin 2-beta-dioxygenase 8-like n=1 Tax=Erythranthe guttata TaxID=4155 RepID=UPI00064D89ED|nr:PREDICTED: gibberellin 2-beta-dioxygenase 8-like [Erythranthe guttata]|eukprot:XP_012846001.1 PREDICTED: gibberellin 2-beta-dioxygenase 8-like [Erythranthe guttata]